MRHFKNTIGAAMVFAASASAAHAADLPSLVTPAPSLKTGDWVVSLAVGPQVLNQFPGSKTYTVLPTGSISRYHAGQAPSWSAPDDGFSIAIFDTGDFKAGPVARFVSRRGLSDGNGNFFGLHNVDSTIELGGFAEFWAMNFFRVHGEVRQAVNGHHGLEANLAMDALQRYYRWTFSAGPRISYGGGKFMNAYFSVNQAEAAANGRVSPYLATGGFDMVGGLATARYDFNDTWNVTLFGGYNRLVGDAGSSPITQRLGSANEFTGGATIGYTFALNKFGVFGF